MNLLELALKSQENTPEKNRANLLKLRSQEVTSSSQGKASRDKAAEYVCRNGHPRTKENIKYYKIPGTMRLRMRCKKCDAERNKKIREQKKWDNEIGGMCDGLG